MLDQGAQRPIRLIPHNYLVRYLKFEDYKLQVSDHLSKAADLALRAKVVALFEDANFLLDKVKMELSVQEKKIVRQLLATKVIPSPKLLIKDHKTIKEKGNSQLGWLGIPPLVDCIVVLNQQFRRGDCFCC